MKFTIGMMAADHPDVLAALHKMRKAAPSAAATTKVMDGYGQTFSDPVRGDLAVHPGLVEHCAPAQAAMHASHATVGNSPIPWASVTLRRESVVLAASRRVIL